MTTLKSKTTSPFCHECQRISHWEAVISSSPKELASSSLLVSPPSESPSSCHPQKPLEKEKETQWNHQDEHVVVQYDYTGVQLIQLSIECIKASIHALKLCYDRLNGHTTRRSRRSGCGWSGRSQRSRHLNPWLLQSKLGLTLLNSRYVYGTHDRKVCRLEIGDRRMAENPCDSKRKNELITGRCILVDMNKGEYEVRE